MFADDVLVSAWRNGQIPIMNGIVFRDGKHVRMKLYSKDSNTYIGDTVITIDEVGAAESANVGKIEFTHYSEYFRVPIPERAIEIVGGDGDMGGDGFIAAVRLIDNTPVWILFFDDSNPFDSAEVRGSTIRAHSTLDCIWEINLDDPTEISITRMAS